MLDEVGYLAYDAHAADLLFEIVNHRYERNSVVLTTNKAFKEWNTVFPNATCIAALLDRLTHHAEVTLIEGDSYRMRESQMEAEAAKKNSKGKPMPNDLKTYRQTLLDLYLRLPDTPRRVSRHDGRLVRQLWERDVPLTTSRLLSCWPPRAAPPAAPTPSRSDPFALCTTSCRSSKNFSTRPSSTPTPTLLTCAARSPCVRQLTVSTGLNKNQFRRPKGIDIRAMRAH